jgi:NAD(P)H-hydrate epimerase
MKILKTSQVKEADAYTIKNEPISSIDLMERAATRASEWILEKFKNEKDFIIFAGTGNNGGDGLVIARKLNEAGKKVRVFIVEFSKKFSEDFKINYDRLKNTKTKIYHITDISQFPGIQTKTIIIDAIFGSGLSRPVKGFAGDIIKKINQIQDKTVISIDIPSGLFGEENHHLSEQNIIKANYTLTFEFPFLSFLFAENQDYVGEFIIIPIGISKEYLEKAETDFFISEHTEILDKLKTRKKFSHKGNYGHGLLIAGSYGKMGAAVMSAKAAHRSGIGLLSAHLCKKCVDIMQISSAETMLSIDKEKKYASKIKNIDKYNAIAVGPAIGFNPKTIEMLRNLFLNAQNKPMIIDADAITIISRNSDLYDIIPQNSILSPHPKEFQRLVGETKNNYKRLYKQIEFSKKYKVIIILKGAFTSVSLPDGRVFFNPTGNPGMATGGSGDVLTGIILALLAQGYSPEDAALLGVYAHGLAGDYAAEEIGQTSLIATDIINYLGDVFDFQKIN